MFKKENKNGFRLRILALSAIVTLLMPSVASCGGTAGGGGGENSGALTPAPSETAVYPGEIIRGCSADEAAKVLDTLPEADFESAATVIAYADHGDMLCPDESSDEVSAAALSRNRSIEKKYNTSIIGKKVASAETLKTELEASSASGIYYADLISVGVGELGAYSQSGLLMNLSSLPGISFDKDYYNTSAMNQLRAGYKLYAVYGAATEDVRSYYAVYYNKALAVSLGMGSLYDLVKNGEWTWERFSQLSHSAAAARGSDAASSIGTMSDLSLDALADAVLSQSGFRYVDTTAGTVPSLVKDETAVETNITFIRGLLARGEGFQSCYQSDYSAVSSFRADSVLFYIGRLSDASTLAPIETDWGLLPLPAYNAETFGVTACDPAEVRVLVTPSYNTQAEHTALIIDALSAASVRCMDDAIVELVQNTCLRDNESISMARYMSSQRAGLDFTSAFGSISSLASATTGAFHTGISGKSYSTLFSRYKTAAESALKQNFPLTNAS